MQKKFTFFFVLLLLVTAAFSQVQTPVYLSQPATGASCKGFYQYLPAGYNTGTANYPVILWIHGAGQVGEGNSTDLPKVLEWGVPKIISEGGFPSVFSIGDSAFSFIVISPQFTGWPSGGNVGAMLNYVMNNYRVDPARVYLMGISAGGGASWEFAGSNVANSNRLAAMISFCGAFAPTQVSANRIAASNLPVWAFHNTNDGTVPVAYSRNWKAYINAYTPAPNPLTKLTEFPVVSSNAVIAHECWSLATLPSYKPEGINIYEWMLGYRQRTTVANLPPLAAAGQDIGVVLPANAVMDGTASVDQDGVIVSYKWRKISGPSSYSISDSTAISPVIGNLAEAVYQFELTVTDNLGATGRDSITINVYHSLPAGAQQRILIDVGANANAGGTITTSPNLNGNTWNNMTDARPGVGISNALTITNQLSGIGIEVINRIDGTYNSASSPGVGNGNTTGIVGDYPASATTDHALIHSSATNGKWRVKGMQQNKIYTIKFWGSRTNTTASRSAEIKRSDDNVWKTYNATANTNFNNAAVFVVAGKTAMDFDIRTKAGSDFSCINVVDISYGADTSITPVNLPPIARAGADTILQLPADSMQLKGCTSSDPENAALKYKWKKIAGPVSLQIFNDTVCATKVNNLVAGAYLFELTVTDTAGLSAKDTLAVLVNPAAVVFPNLPPVARAGADTTLQLPVDSMQLRGCTSSDPENAQLKYKWKKIAGPASFQIANDTACTARLNSLLAGTYSFELAVTDTGGLVARDSVTITVLQYFSLAWPPQVAPACGKAYKVVIVGSSTAYGTGANPIDSSWVKKFTAFLLFQNSQIQVVNLATPGLTSYDVSATGTSVPAPFSVDTMRNITKALSLNPDAIIVNLPSNDVARGIPTNTIHQNFENITMLADNQNVPIWVSTSQPRDGLSPAENILQMNLRDWINTRYGNKAVDFWSSVANADGTINSFYSAGDGVHLNNYGHHLLFTRIIQEKIWDTICNRTATVNKLPTANAGADMSITLPVNSAALAGSGADMDGTIISYIWTKLTGPSAYTISGANTANATAGGLVQGVYSFQLTVTDNAGAIARDTMLLTVNAAVPPANILPLANAGPDIALTLPANTAILTGTATDADGTIVGYSWTKIGGPAAGTITNANTANATAGDLVQGQYIYQLLVTDNAGATAKDTMQITVNAQVLNTKKINVNIYGGSNPYNNVQWNNWNVASTLTSNAFYYDDGTASTVNAIMTSSALISDNGTTYATAATVCPVPVLRYNSANTSYRTVTINGLDAQKKYNLEFYASRGNTGNSSIYQIGSLSDTISTDNNINDFAKFLNVSPNSAGKIIVTISRIGTWNYIAGFVVKEAGSAAAPVSRTMFAEEEIKTGQIQTARQEKFILFPNPSRDKLKIILPSFFEKDVRINIINSLGKVVYTEVVSNVIKGAVNIIDLQKLQAGMYILQVQSSEENIVRKFFKL